MKFVLPKNYNVPDVLFNHEPKLSYNFIGNLLIDHIIGPSGSNAIDHKKAISLRKVVSESLERRALMNGGYKEENGQVGYLNIIDQSIGYIDYDFTRYRVTGSYISDTTGTAVSHTSKDAIYKATTELLEKNSLFLFWYGLLGRRVSLKWNNPYIKAIQDAGYQINLYEVDYFRPFNTYVTVIHNGIDRVYSCGVSGDLNHRKALEHSIKESYLLFWQNTFKAKRNSTMYDDFSKQSHLEFIQYLENFKQLIAITPQHEKDSDYTIQDIINSLPNWVTELNVVMLKTNSRQRQKVVLVFSRDLMNSIPLKRVINLDTPINKHTLNLSKGQLDAIPECMIM